MKLWLLLLLFLTSCSTTKDVATSSLCNSTSQSYVFILAVHTKTPKGIHLAKINQYLKDQIAANSFVKNNLIQILTAKYIDETTQEFVSNLPLYNMVSKNFKKGYGPTLPDLKWLEDNKFVFCYNESCDNLPYPVLPKKQISFPKISYCNDFYINDGYNSGLSCKKNPYGLHRYIRKNDFKLGQYISSTYLVPTKSFSKELCEKANLAPNCFDIFENKSIFLAFQNNLETSQDFPFFKSSGNFPDSDIQKLVSQSNFTKDLILKASSQISTQSIQDWDIHRITFNSTNLCKYGKSYADFFTD